MNDRNRAGIFRVLTLDGGGMRGLYTASLLQTLARLFDERFVEQEPDIGRAFDLICGTSTGAILSCALSAGVSLDRVCDLDRECGPLIFPRPAPKPTNKIKLLLWSAQHLRWPAACSHELRRRLEQIFGNQTLVGVFESRKIAMCIPAVDALNHQAWVFKTPHASEKHRDNNYRLADVCMASTAAPIFFPLVSLRNPDNDRELHYFVDGGLWANNPVLVGLTEALVVSPPDCRIEIISVGTCNRPSGDPYAVQDPVWGLLKWKVGIGIIDMSLSAQAFGYENMARFIAAELSKCGRAVTVTRLEQGQKSPEQYSAIDLDKSDQVAIDTLINMAGKDAANIHGKVLSGNRGDLAVIGDVFTNLLPLKSRDHGT